MSILEALIKKEKPHEHYRQTHVQDVLPEPGLGPGSPASGSGPAFPSGFGKLLSAELRQHLSPPWPAAAGGGRRSEEMRWGRVFMCDLVYFSINGDRLVDFCLRNYFCWKLLHTVKRKCFLLDLHQANPLLTMSEFQAVWYWNVVNKHCTFLLQVQAVCRTSVETNSYQQVEMSGN